MAFGCILKLQRLAVEGNGLGSGGQLERPRRGQFGIMSGLSRLTGLVIMGGKLPGNDLELVGVNRFQRLGGPAMQKTAPGQAQIVTHHGGYQGVGKVIAVICFN